MYESTKMDDFAYWSIPFFTDRAYEPDLLTNEGLLGLNLVADPASGFSVVYKARYGEAPIHGYPALTGNKAVIIAGSGGWDNYRFQADALEYYQMLRSAGYSDDDIILIMSDDLAQNASNPEKGVVRRSLDGDNLYKNVVVDYRLEDITYNDLAVIFSGKADVAHPQVLDSGTGDNVLFFWSSHGTQAGLALGDIDHVSGKQMARILQKMSNEQRFRKMMWIVEACYSGGVAKECEGIPGLLVMTAANANESSKADLWYAPYGVYLTNH